MKKLLLFSIIILFASFTYADDPVLLDSYSAAANTNVAVYYCGSYSPPSQPFNCSTDLNKGDTLEIELYTSDTTAGLEATDLINVTIVAANTSGEPTGEPTIYAQNVTGGTWWDAISGFQGKNLTFTLDSAMPAGWYIMILKCENCEDGTSEKLVLKVSDPSSYHGLTAYGKLDLKAGCNIWQGTETDFPDETFTGFRVWGTAGEAATFEPPTPSNGTRNNSQVVINVSCEVGDVSLWFDANADPITKVIDEATSPADYTTSVSEGTYYYKASCDNGDINSSVRTWTYDITKPTILLNGVDNFFNWGNNSLQSQYSDLIDINITVTDANIYGFYFNMTNTTVVLLNYSTESLSGTSFNFNTTINTSTWEADVYNITVSASDSHTVNAIDDYRVTTKDKTITFITAEGNTISITPDISGVTTYKKLTDRYSFSFDFGKSLVPSKTFTIVSSNKMDYLPNSIYSGHFVIMNGRRGNWLDFQGAKVIPIVNKINDYSYTLTYNGLSNDITFNSIGGLNTITQDFKWYKGSTNLSVDSDLPVAQTNITLNISTHTTISDIRAELIYNGVKYSAPNQTNYTNFKLFVQNVTSTASDTTYSWNITVTQNDTNSTSFLKSTTHDISQIDIDNCTNNSVVGLNFTIYGENSLEIIDVNITGTFEYWPTSNPDYLQNFTIDFTSTNGFRICISNNISYATDAYFQYEGDGNIKERYYLEGTLINATTQYVNLYNFEGTSGTSKLRAIVKDEIYDEMADVIMKLLRFYPGENLWRTVQIDKSDEFGRGIFYVVENEEDYKFIFERDGVVLDTTTSVKYICDSANDPPCEQTFIIYPIAESEKWTGLTGSISFNNDTNMLYFTWNDVNNVANSVSFLVQNQRSDKTYTICELSATSSSGTLLCNATGYTGIITARAYRAQSPNATWISEYYEIFKSAALGKILAQEGYKLDGAMLAGFVMMVLIGFGVATGSALVVILFSFGGLLFAFLLDLTPLLDMTMVVAALVMAIVAMFLLSKRGV